MAEGVCEWELLWPRGCVGWRLVAGGGVERSSPQHTPGVHPSGVAAPSVSTGHWCRTPWCVVIGLTLG